MSKINKIQVDETTYDIEDLSVPSWAKAETKPTYNYSEIQNTPDLSNYITKDVNDLTYYYDKTTIDTKISSVYKYKGSVATYQDLPSSDLTIGDVYNVESDGSNYAWTGTTWDKLGGTIDLSGYQTKIDSSHKLDADLVDDTSSTNKFVSASDKTTWNGKYTKPNDGIPSTDLSSAVQTSLGKADTAIQDISGKQDIMQYSTMPTASSSNIGKIIQFTGTTDNTYTNGYFYICVESSGNYSWQRIDVQPGSSSDGVSVNVDNATSGNAYSHPFIFENKLGMYFYSNTYNSTMDFYYKLTSSGSIKYKQVNAYITRIYIYKKFEEASNNEYFAWLTGVNANSGNNGQSLGKIMSLQVKKSNNDISIDNTNYDMGYGNILMDKSTQTITGTKKFAKIPEVSSYSAPTLNTQLTAKKYVDDSISNAIGNINTILATLTTPSGN